jgi:predicted TIM-barrel fold metal-dependent hydrolase
MLDRLLLRDYRPQPALRVHGSEPTQLAVPAVDAHNHLGRWLHPTGGWMVEDVGALLAVMDEVGVETVVNLDGRWDEELEANLDRYDRAHPGRFLTFCHASWERALRDGASVEVERLRRSREAGARGLKVWKDLGLGVCDPQGRYVLPDDERLAPIFEEAGALGLPVLIHSADPIAFFDPPDERNERLEELAAHPDWSFSDPSFPAFDELMASLDRLLGAHPGTTFIGAHVGCCAEDLGLVASMLERHANWSIDVSARIAELGRQPRATAALIRRFPDRVLLGTDSFPPSRETYLLHARFIQTADEHFAYNEGGEWPPPQGRWYVSALDLEPELLPALYAGNARRLIGS